MDDFRQTKKRTLNNQSSFNERGNPEILNPDQHLLQRTLSTLPNKTVEEAKSLNDNLSSIGMRTRHSVTNGYNKGIENENFYNEQQKLMSNQPRVLDNSQITLPSYKRSLLPDDFEPIEFRRVQTDIPGGFNQYNQQQIQQQYLWQQLQYQQHSNDYQQQNRSAFQRPTMNINTGMPLNHTRSELPQQYNDLQLNASGIPGLEYARTKSSLHDSEIELERRLSEIDENKDKIKQIENAIHGNPDDMEF